MRAFINSGVVVICWFCGIAHAASNCYVLRPVVRDGKERPIESLCRVMEKNLNRFCGQPPMVCALKIHPDFKRLLTQPNWRPLPPDRKRVEAFIRGPWKIANTSKLEDNMWREDAPKIEVALIEKRLHFAEADVDIYNLGKKQPAYRLDFGDCEVRNPQSNDSKYNETWTKPLAGSEIRIHHTPEVLQEMFSRYLPIGRSHLNQQLFVFRGKTYSFGMLGHEINSATGEVENLLWINRRERKSRPGIDRPRLLEENICEFEYHPYKEE